VELLAPVGYMDALKAAVLGGAEAVYLAGKDFGARRLADNFNDDEMRGAIRYAHENKVKVYVTVNTLIKESEMAQAVGFLDFLHMVEADAIIVQDRGLMRYALDNTKLNVHASTQMGIHCLDGVKWAESQGLDRVILSRELTLEQIRHIKERSKIELEVFIHGALCYCFSGGCLFSSMLGGRSGNRGMCAQPCRKHYSIGEDEGYLLSTADTFGVESIPELLKMGIASLKVEGRMRSTQYVYLTSKIYSAAINRAKAGKKELITTRERDLLETVFNRGFGRGYLQDENLVQSEYADSRGLPLGNAISEGRIIKVWTDKLSPGDGITFYQRGEKIGGFEVKRLDHKDKATLLESPFNLPQGDYLAYKTKDREFEGIQKMVDGVKINPLRWNRRPVNFDMPSVSREGRKPEISFYVSSGSVMESVLPQADRIYFEMNKQWELAREICDAQGVEFVLLLPRISPEVPEVDAKQVMACTVGQMHRYRDRKVYGHYSLNYFNSFTVPRLYQYTLSVELSKPDILDICMHTPDRLEAMVFGRMELMVTKDPGLKEGMLIDEKGKRFQVYRDPTGYAHILNSAETFLLDNLDELEAIGVDSFGIDLRRRHPDLAKLVADTYSRRNLGMKKLLHKKCGAFTAAHFDNGVA
jgi:putative protease